MPGSIRDLLNSYFRDRYGFSDEELSQDLQLSNLMDSLGFMDLISHLEQHLKLRIDMMSISEDTFGSMSSVVRYLEGLRKAQPG